MSPHLKDKNSKNFIFIQSGRFCRIKKNKHFKLILSSSKPLHDLMFVEIKVSCTPTNSNGKYLFINEKQVIHLFGAYHLLKSFIYILLGNFKSILIISGKDVIEGISLLWKDLNWGRPGWGGAHSPALAPSPKRHQPSPTHTG